MNVIDIILSIALCFGFIKGFSKGFIIEVSSLGALFLGLVGAIKFSEFVADILKGFFDWSPLAIQTFSYLVVFIIIVYLISIMAKALTKFIKKASLGLFNKFLGGFFGVLKWSILMSVALFFIAKLSSWVSIIDEEMIDTSLLYRPITELGECLFSWGSELSKELPDDLI